MEKQILFILIITSFLCFSTVAKGVIIDPDIEFIVENETYVVQTSMDFNSITISETYIVFNTTGFHISSPNNIRITLVSLHGDITGADNGEKVVAFYAETFNGEVWFSLSGFPPNNEYVVNRDGDPISYPTANNSGFITYSNSDWSIQLFEIIQIVTAPPNSPPVVTDIPNQMINQGESFAPILLDDYVTDTEDPDENISWSYSGNSELIVSIVDRIANVTVPDLEWEGQESVTFTAEDTGGLTDSDDATFIVIVEINPPGGEEPPEGGEPPDGGGGGGETNSTDHNMPPEVPATPFGPISIELGVEYTYSSSTFDPDGDLVRLRFDWGDDTFSQWSDFFPSNTTISMSHEWNFISAFEIRVIAQDEQGMNSSWSDPLTVIVDPVEQGDELSIIPDIAVMNQTVLKKGSIKVIFDASGSIDSEGLIKSYEWDFGDGKTGRGIRQVHVYKNPGEYTVILIITDESGNEYSTSITVYLGADEAGQQAVINFYPENGILIGIIGMLVLYFVLYFKKHIESYSLLFTSRKLRKINARIDSLKSANKERFIIGTTSIAVIEQFCDNITKID